MYFVFALELNRLLPCFGLSTYTETVDPACRPTVQYSIRTVLYAIRQGSVRFNLRKEESAPFPFTIFLYIIYLWVGPSSRFLNQLIFLSYLKRNRYEIHLLRTYVYTESWTSAFHFTVNMLAELRIKLFDCNFSLFFFFHAFFSPACK